MIVVEIGSKNFNEISFVVNVLLQDILGMQYQILKTENQISTKFKVGTKEINIINSLHNSTAYIFPKVVKEVRLSYENNEWLLLHLYGNAGIEKIANAIMVYTDVIAASFFMLSRWEESVIEKKDMHDRFDAQEALCVKTGYYERPIVDEYAAFLKDLIMISGYEGFFSEKQANLLVSHDIDHTVKWRTWYKAVKSGFDHGNIGIKELVQYISNGHDATKDPYFNFDVMRSIANRYGIKLTFYFAAIDESSVTSYDHFDYNIDDDAIRKATDAILADGHEIGLHPSYNTYNNEELLAEQKYKLEKVLQLKVIRCRQHYLRYDIKSTPQILNKLGFEEDSSMHYSIGPGFRTGTSHKHSMFDLTNNTTLAIKQQPLIFMDTHYMVKTEEETMYAFEKVSNEVKKSKGQMTLLWHNNNLWPENKALRFTNILNNWFNKVS